ncbi:MAG: helix-turn-helix transcriptional regulator [Bacteriovoracaceae bacterium]
MSSVNYSEILSLPDNEFNSRIKFFLIINYLLKSKNISKEEFAKKCDISYSRLKKFLRFDKTNFYYEEMLQICKFFKIPLYELEQGYLYQEYESDSPDFSQKYFGTSMHLFTSGTVCYLHRLNYIRTSEWKNFIKICLNAKIDPIYFVNLHNACNINFNLTG